MRKIYFIIPTFNDAITGGTMYDLQLCRYLKKIYINVNTIFVDHRINHKKLFAKIQLLPKHSIIYIDGYIADKITGFMRKRKNICILIHHPKSLEYSDRMINLNLFFKEKFAFSNAKSIMTVSKYMKRTINKYLTKKVNVNIIKPGIDQSFFKCVINKNSHNILTIGNIIPRKGYIWLIKSLSKLDCDWHLNIIGKFGKDDEYYKFLIKTIKSYNIENKISFLGTISSKKLCKYLVNSKLFVLTTYYEGFGMSLLEASIAGLKVITTDLPVLRETLRNRDVLFITKNDHTSLSNSINICLSGEPVKKSKNNYIYSWERAALEFKQINHG